MNRYLKTIKFVNLKKNFTPQWHTIQIHFILSNETFFYIQPFKTICSFVQNYIPYNTLKRETL